MLSKVLLAISLAVAPVVSVSAQVENTFNTYQTADKYLQDFDYLREWDYRLSYTLNDEADYSHEPYLYYVFPIYYDIVESYNVMRLYYSNNEYQFYYFFENAYEVVVDIHPSNYSGGEVKMPFLALNYNGMNQVIEHDKTEKSNSISIYNSFYKFFTGFFPNEVVNEYHGIFTFVIVAFLLFLVFGFVFYLFRVIRRLVGFK